MKNLLFIYLIFILASCSYTIVDENKFEQNDESTPIMDEKVFLPDTNFVTEKFAIKDLLNHWMDSREFRSPKIWRPKDYKDWERTRFRGEIVFNNNGEYRKLILSPNDAHYYKKYRWRLLKENPEILISFNEKGERISKMKIEKLDSVTLIFYQ